ncbi:MAG: hypothetical protein DELT_01416 [Desulfovibrio sp.]
MLFTEEEILFTLCLVTVERDTILVKRESVRESAWGGVILRQASFSPPSWTRRVHFRRRKLAFLV